MSEIILKRGKSKPFFSKEPLVFSGAIQQVIGKPLVADMVNVYSAEKKIIGRGLFNPYSNYRVRLLTFAYEKLPNTLPEIMTYRLTQAIERRRQLNLPNQRTDAYRLFNSEADGLSGLTIDIFAKTAVVSVSAYWLMLYRQLVCDSLEKLGFSNIIWRPQIKPLQQDGWKIDEMPEQSGQQKIRIKENELLYQVDLYEGQETGFYCDQRENRLLVQQHAAQRTVLDAFCYTGGFALNAAVGGAKQIIGIDSSAPAIELAMTNAALNSLTHVQFIQEKVENYLPTATDFDFIILDPPKFAPTQQSLPRAKQRYLKLNQLALAILPTNGLLLTCSCSNAVTEKGFLEVIHAAARKTDRSIEILNITSAGQDHPYLTRSHYGHYLKAVLLRVK